MAYRFKLEALMRFRQHLEDQLQKELADVIVQKEQAVGLLKTLENKLEQIQQELYRQQNNAIPGGHLAIYPRFLERMARDICDQQQMVAAAERKCQEMRQALMEAVQKRKTLEKLKEKDLNTYLADLSLEEQKFINEMAINRFNFQRL